MGVALFVVPEKGLKVDAFMDGKALAHAIEHLEDLCEALGVVPLEEFMDHTEALELLEDFEDDPEDEDLSEDFEAEEALAADREWFDPSEAQATVQALLEALPDSVLTQFGPFGLSDVIEDLQDLKRILDACVAEDVRFHLALDF